MSQENLVENVEPVPIEDEKKETDDDHDKELELDPSNVTGNNLVLADNATDTIVRWLRIGTNSSRRQESVDELIRRLDEDGYQENLANAIIRYIMERPCDLVELSNRCLNVEAVMKRWPNSGTPVLNAINAVLSADQRLGTPRSPNLTRFITCCLEENAFDERCVDFRTSLTTRPNRMGQALWMTMRHCSAHRLTLTAGEL
uniref:Death domain-containing protein n=1 Tax=Panagrellus redivivus TaxID=6233 RepID=A0A7E4VDI8_PANRE